VRALHDCDTGKQQSCAISFCTCDIFRVCGGPKAAAALTACCLQTTAPASLGCEADGPVHDHAPQNGLHSARGVRENTLLDGTRLRPMAHSLSTRELRPGAGTCLQVTRPCALSKAHLTGGVGQAHEGRRQHIRPGREESAIGSMGHHVSWPQLRGRVQPSANHLQQDDVMARPDLTVCLERSTPGQMKCQTVRAHLFSICL